MALAFPSTCPHVTSIGATQINPGATVVEPEVACNQVIFSGGGFSNVFPMPSYQQAAVQNYLTNYKPSDVTNSMFNATVSFLSFVRDFMNNFRFRVVPTQISPRTGKGYVSFIN